jgi:hypothetical protein
MYLRIDLVRHVFMNMKLEQVCTIVIKVSTFDPVIMEIFDFLSVALLMGHPRD